MNLLAEIHESHPTLRGTRMERVTRCSITTPILMICETSPTILLTPNLSHVSEDNSAPPRLHWRIQPTSAMKYLAILSLAALALSQNVCAAELDQYGGNAALKGEATGWFHVEEIGGRWFFVTPEGNAFFSLGVTHTGETIRQDELGVFQSRFESSEEKMGDFFLERLRAWGFNGAGYGALEMMEQRIPYVATIWTEGPRSKSAGSKSQNTDIFDLKVQERLRGKVSHGCGTACQESFLPRLCVH